MTSKVAIGLKGLKYLSKVLVLYDHKVVFCFVF